MQSIGNSKKKYEMSLFLVLSTKTGHVTRLMDSRKEICIHEYWGNKTIWVLGFVNDLLILMRKFMFNHYIVFLQQSTDNLTVRRFFESWSLNPVSNAIHKGFIQKLKTGEELQNSNLALISLGVRKLKLDARLLIF